MRRLFRIWSSLDAQRQSNLIAGGIVLAAIGFLRLEAAPVPAGSETMHRSATRHLALKLEMPVVANLAAATTTSAESVADQTGAPLSPAELARQTLERKLAQLKAGIAFLRKTPDYTAQFMKQELVGGELSDEQEISLKVRHEPFSVYLKWNTGDRGREVLYVDGENDGEMLVRAGRGLKAKLGTLSLAPDGTLAMSEARYPITKAGLLELALIIEEAHEVDLKTSNFSRCEQLADQEFDGRKCWCYYIEYADAQGSPQYRKSVTLIDQEWSVPVYIKNYAWPTPDLATADPEAMDEATLIEYYTYSEVRFRQQLANSDFDRENEEYRLH
jgi:hypothetical protein